MDFEQIKLNLFCGEKHKVGFYNVDIVEPADTRCRVGSEQLPFADNSADYVEIDNGLEHLDNEQFLFAMNDIHRVLKSGGHFWFRVPNFAKWMEGAVADPTHYRFFIKESIDYFIDKPAFHRFGKSYGFKMWKLVKLDDGQFLNVVLEK